MKYKRLLRKIPIDFRLIGIICIALFLGYLLFFISPQHVAFVALFILLITLLTFLLTGYFVQKKFRYILALSIFLFLGINYTVGFDIINTLLLISFIIGLTLVVK